MTDSVAAQIPVAEHVGNGVTTSFAYTFTILDSADMVVEIDGVAQGSGFTVSGVGVLAGGAVLFTSAPASGVSVLLRRSTDLSRSTSYTYAGDLRETVVDEDFNRLWHAMQERAEVEARSMRAPVGETLDALPPASQRADTQLLFDSAGEPYCGAPVSGSAADVMLQYASTDAGKGAALVGVQDAAGRVAAGTAEAWLAALSDPEILANAQTGIDPTGVTESTSVIQACIDAMALQTHGGRVVLRGTYLVDTLLMKSNVTLDMTAGALLNFKAHTTSHNPVIRMGDASAAISGAKVLGGEIDGNAAGQTFASEEWSHGVFIWGSDDNEVRGVKIHDTKGDGVTIGYDSARVVGSNRNKVVDCDIYNPSVSPGRMCIAVTYGDENRILYNKCSGVIDLELNASIGECKNNLVLGNTGRAQTENLTGPRLSDLVISMASLNTDPLRYYGNEVIANHCCFISMQYNKKSLIAGNVVVGSTTTQARLIDVSGCDDTIISGNQFDGNVAVATGLTDIIRTRGCAVLQVVNNQVRGDAVSTRPFHNFINTFSASTAADHVFLNNQTETGWYRNGACQQPTEKARFRINQDAAGSLTATQVSGVKCNFSVSRSAANIIVSQVGNCGTQYLIQLDPQCNATTTSAAPAITHSAAHTYTIAGSNRTITVLTYAPAAGAVTLAAFSFAAAGNTGTFFMDVTF